MVTTRKSAADAICVNARTETVEVNATNKRRMIPSNNKTTGSRIIAKSIGAKRRNHSLSANLRPCDNLITHNIETRSPQGFTGAFTTCRRRRTPMRGLGEFGIGRVHQHTLKRTPLLLRHGRQSLMASASVIFAVASLPSLPTKPARPTNVGTSVARPLRQVGIVFCRMKNPDLCNISKSTFLLKASIEGLTDGTSHRSDRIKSFRNAVGIEEI